MRGGTLRIRHRSRFRQNLSRCLTPRSRCVPCVDVALSTGMCRNGIGDHGGRPGTLAHRIRSSASCPAGPRFSLLARGTRRRASSAGCTRYCLSVQVSSAPPAISPSAKSSYTLGEISIWNHTVAAFVKAAPDLHHYSRHDYLTSQLTALYTSWLRICHSRARETHRLDF